MGLKKMSRQEAHCVARDIATKAFAHLFIPHTNAMTELCYDIYVDFLTRANIGAEQLKVLGEFDMVNLCDNHLRIYFQTPSGQHVGSEHVSPEGKLLPLISNTITCKSPAFISGYRDLLAAAQPLREKHAALVEELTNALEGQSATRAMKEWPEAAAIIADYFGLAMPQPLPKPLEALLARHMPLLPAPAAS
jgi:hypothetical protein